MDGRVLQLAGAAAATRMYGIAVETSINFHNIGLYFPLGCGSTETTQG